MVQILSVLTVLAAMLLAALVVLLLVAWCMVRAARVRSQDAEFFKKEASTALFMAVVVGATLLVGVLFGGTVLDLVLHEGYPVGVAAVASLATGVVLGAVCWSVWLVGFIDLVRECRQVREPRRRTGAITLPPPPPPATGTPRS